MDDSHGAVYGLDRYTGGMNGSASNWPGMQDREPLLIPSNRVIVYFHTDGSGVDWGFKVRATRM